ncbi:putative DNA repair protein [Staphylococcus phage vB_SauH_DELF3]|nr:putative DNA repair protein [Staphylococcus phage vB_SauH_DELF3]
MPTAKSGTLIHTSNLKPLGRGPELGLPLLSDGNRAGLSHMRTTKLGHLDRILGGVIPLGILTVEFGLGPSINV